MNSIGTVESLWRYPVKSMAGEQLPHAFLGFAGVYGDRLYAFRDTAAPAGFPFLTAREQEHMLLFHPSFRNSAAMDLPPNLAEAQALAPGVTPVYATPAEVAVDVTTPTGQTIPVDSPEMLDFLSDGLRKRHHLSLIHSDRAITDCRPVSLFATQTVHQLASELGATLDKRRFRSNIYLDLSASNGFSEDALVGHKLRIGPTVTLSVLDRDPRCKIITLDPETAAPSPDVIRQVARAHAGTAGVYAAVLVEGLINPGDDITLLD